MSKDKELDAFLSKVDEIGIYSNGPLNLIFQAKIRKALLLFSEVFYSRGSEFIRRPCALKHELNRDF